MTEVRVPTRQEGRAGETFYDLQVDCRKQVNLKKFSANSSNSCRNSTRNFRTWRDILTAVKQLGLLSNFLRLTIVLVTCRGSVRHVNFSQVDIASGSHEPVFRSHLKPPGLISNIGIVRPNEPTWLGRDEAAVGSIAANWKGN